jgi:predicted nucleic acid-binding protein
MLIYFDMCSFNRPYDDQVQPLIRLETEAKLLIQSEVIKNDLHLAWSFMLEYENNDNPFCDRKNRIAAWKAIATVQIAPTPEILALTQKITELGIRTKDASHLACAITANADFFITTDKKLLNKHINGITIISPIDFVGRYFDDN